MQTPCPEALPPSLPPCPLSCLRHQWLHLHSLHLRVSPSCSLEPSLSGSPAGFSVPLHSSFLTPHLTPPRTHETHDPIIRTNAGHQASLMPGTTEMATRMQLWPSPAPATPAPTEKKGQGGTEAVPEGRPERSHRGALGSVTRPSHPNPNTSFQQPAKGLALGTRVRDESNHSLPSRSSRPHWGHGSCVALQMSPRGSAVPSHVGDCRSLG